MTTEPTQTCSSRTLKTAKAVLCMYSTCVGWPNQLLPALNYLIDNGEEVVTSDDKKERAMQREEFLSRIYLPDAEKAVPSWDWHVEYYKLPGFDVYWFVHSAIEHVYADDGDILKVNELALEQGY